MLKVQVPPSESTHSSLLLPKPFLSGYGTVTLAIWPRPALFQKRKGCSIRSCLPVDTKPVLHPINELSRKNFPPGFYFGTASSAYQYEGAPFEDGKGESNWDHFTHTYPEKIKDRSNGDVALDSYHRYKEDVAIMKDMGVNAYRFSIAWTRILPNGKRSGGENREGIRYYNELIDKLLLAGIQPFVTIFHWDVPQALEDEYGGFLSPQIIDDFRDYAEVCYREFGDRVKYWITLNEPFTFTHEGYVNGMLPPGKKDNPGTDPYRVAHHLLLSHAAAVRIYKDKYQATQNGKIGITLNHHCMVPYSNQTANVAAAKRATDFMLGWFMDPITTGEYPQSMQDLVGPRLPRFYKDQSEMLKGSYDFLGLNYYTGNYVQDAFFSNGGFPPQNPSFQTDCRCIQTTQRDGIPIGPPTGSSWLHVYPEGLRDILIYIMRRYNNPLIYITENGISENSELPMEEALNDEMRKFSLRGHLKSLLEAMEEGVFVKGFFVWTLLDNFEWSSGFTERFGMNYVDFKDGGLKRYPKKSAHWFKNFLKP